MKKAIYELFTAENGIRMSAEVLEYISECAVDGTALKAILHSFKTRFNTATIDIAQVDQIINQQQEKKTFFRVHASPYRQNTLAARYESMKQSMGFLPVPISLLEEGVKNTIFGIFYKSRSGACVLEDYHGIVELDISGSGTDMFLFENMFVAAEGVLRGSVFAVEVFIRPPIAPYNKQNNFLVQKDAKICLFGCFNSQSTSASGKTAREIIDKAVVSHCPDIVIMSVCPDNKEIYDNPLVRTITCPCRHSESYLPAKSKNTTATNPFTLELFDRKISFIEHPIFEHKSRGIFCNQSPLESFLRSVISQRSYNPFAKCDMSYADTPNIIVISQDFYPLVMDVDGIQVVSLLALSDDSYAVIDTASNKVEIIEKA